MSGIKRDPEYGPLPEAEEPSSYEDSLEPSGSGSSLEDAFEDLGFTPYKYTETYTEELRPPTPFEDTSGNEYHHYHHLSPLSDNSGYDNYPGPSEDYFDSDIYNHDKSLAPEEYDSDAGHIGKYYPQDEESEDEGGPESGSYDSYGYTEDTRKYSDSEDTREYSDSDEYYSDEEDSASTCSHCGHHSGSRDEEQEDAFEEAYYGRDNDEEDYGGENDEDEYYGGDADEDEYESDADDWQSY